MTEFKHFINGEYTAGKSGATFENRRPHDGTLIGHVASAGKDDVDAAVTAARQALGGTWGAVAVEDRCEMLRSLAAEIAKRSDDFVDAEMSDTGQPRTMVAHAFIPRGAANFRIFADAIKNLATESFQTPTPDGAGAINYAIRKPKGVIAVVSPWNAPFLLMTWKIAPALACGNTVVVKPSEETPATATLLGEVMNHAGIPKGVYNVVHGYGPDAAGEWLTRHAGVDAITFTGESKTGTAIMKAAAENLCDVSFELGGKNAGIIFADADMNAAVDSTIRSAFLNCGQTCLGTERLYVERPIFEAFVAALSAKASKLKPGDPADPATSLGPLISQGHRDKVLSYYERARADGGRVVLGGDIPDLPGALAGGSWVEPTIWTGLKDDSTVLKEEIFGPCCHVRPFDTEDEVVALANDTNYGLSTTIWTRDLSRAHRMADRINVGITWVNTWFLRDLRTPFGGSGRSGIGREGGVHSLEFYTELRNVCIKL